jgi:hypothetical protein
MKLVLFSINAIVFSIEAMAQHETAFYTTITVANPKKFTLSNSTDYLPVQKKKPEVRPFITDDARVVGDRLAQIESWVRFDKESGQHWILGAYGPTENLELTIGGVYGYQAEKGRGANFAFALPLLQAKYLVKPYHPGKGPGVAMVAGTFLPAGKGEFKPAGYGTFGFLIVTQCFGEGEKLLLHANAGANYLHINGANNTIATWGFGTQVNVYKGMNLVGEFFSGDPYIPGTGTAYQVGYRYFFSDLLQIDMTVGKGIAGETVMPFWFSAGVRVVTEKFKKARAVKRVKQGV